MTHISCLENADVVLHFYLIQGVKIDTVVNIVFGFEGEATRTYHKEEEDPEGACLAIPSTRAA